MHYNIPGHHYPRLLIRADLPVALQKRCQHDLRDFRVHVIHLESVQLGLEQLDVDESTLKYFLPLLNYDEASELFQREIDYWQQNPFAFSFQTLFPGITDKPNVILQDHDGTQVYTKAYRFGEITKSSVKALITRVKQDLYVDEDDDNFDPETPEGFEEESLDEETQAIIDQFEKNIKQLSSAQMLKVTAAIKRVILQQNVKSDEKAHTELVITNEYEIKLPEYNINIELNALTKALYIFFLMQEEPVHLDDLHLYEPAIMELYLNTSNKNDVEQMRQTLKRALDPETKSIYTHFSRIKSSFYRKMMPELAKPYIISGSGRHHRYVKLPKDAMNINC